MKRFFSLGLALALALVLAPFASAQAEGKKALFIIPQENFQDDEFAKPLSVLKASGIAVTVASTVTTEVTGMNGAKTVPDVLLKDVNVADFNAVVFIGGSGAAQYIDDPLAHKVAMDAVAAGKLVGAICLAPRILASAGVLKGKNATVYPTEGEKLKAAGVNYTAAPVEVDGRLVTADGPGSAEQFGQALLAMLQEKFHGQPSR